jgi:biopolymer transport protein ExbD
MAMIRRNSKVEDKIPTSSMADIAFLLLIFFLTTTTFDEEIGLQVVLPSDAPESEVEVPPQNLIFYLVQPDGSVIVRRGESQAEQVVTARQVEGIMRQALISNPKIIGVIQTSPQARYEHMINVLDAIQSSGATRFSLQELEG